MIQIRLFILGYANCSAPKPHAKAQLYAVPQRGLTAKWGVTRLNERSDGAVFTFFKRLTNTS